MLEKILGILKESVKIKISVKSIVHRSLDEAVEPSLDEAVEETKTQLDDIAKSALYPVLAEKLKERADIEIDKLKEKLPESVRDFIEIE